MANEGSRERAEDDCITGNRVMKHDEPQRRRDQYHDGSQGAREHYCSTGDGVRTHDEPERLRAGNTAKRLVAQLRTMMDVGSTTVAYSMG